MQVFIFFIFVYINVENAVLSRSVLVFQQVLFRLLFWRCVIDVGVLLLEVGVQLVDPSLPLSARCLQRTCKSSLRVTFV